MSYLRTPPPAEFRTARIFNLGVAALVFCLMLAFAAWVMVSAVASRPADPFRALAGAVLGVGALMLLAAVRTGWRSGEPFQRSRSFVLGTAVLGIGASVLVATLV